MKNSTSKGSMTKIDSRHEQSKQLLESSFNYRRRIKEQTINEENKKMFSKLMKIVSFDSKASIPNTIVVACEYCYLLLSNILMHNYLYNILQLICQNRLNHQKEVKKS